MALLEKSVIKGKSWSVNNVSATPLVPRIEPGYLKIRTAKTAHGYRPPDDSN